MKNTEIILREESSLLSAVHPDALKRRDEILESCSLVVAVKNELTNQVCVEAQKAIRSYRAEIEKARKRAKDPFWEAGKQIDALAAELDEPLEARQRELDAMASEYQQELQRQRNEAARKQAEEMRRIEREKYEAERIAEEAARKVQAESKSVEEAELAKVLLQADLEARQAILRQQQEAALTITGPAKAEGQTVREVWKFEVVDPWKLARMHPGLVEITVRKSEVNNLLSSGTREIAGLRIWKETVAGVTSAKGRVFDV